MLPESGCKSKKENLKSRSFRNITLYLTFIPNLIMQVLKLQKVDKNSQNAVYKGFLTCSRHNKSASSNVNYKHLIC